MIQWADDFSRYGTGSGSTTAMLDGLPYANLSTGSENTGAVADPDPNVSGRCLRIRTGGQNDFRLDCRVALPSPTAGLIGVVARFWLPSLPATQNTRPSLIQLSTVSNSKIAQLIVNQNGSITVRKNGDASVGESVVPVVTPNAWHHIEFKYDLSDGTGEVFVNGVSKVSVTGGTVGTCALTSHSGRSDNGGFVGGIYMKDFVIWDGSGTENNDAMGTVKVGRLKPVADVSLGGWVPSTGSTGYDLLAKNAPNDATYLSADDAPPAAMSFEFEDLPPDVTSVRALMPMIRARKTDGGDAQVQTALSPNGTDWDSGADRPITSAFSYWFDVSELSPATASPWSPIEVNDLIGSVDRTL